MTLLTLLVLAIVERVCLSVDGRKGFPLARQTLAAVRARYEFIATASRLGIVFGDGDHPVTFTTIADTE